MMDFISNNLTNIIGYTASICMILGYMPQAIYTIRTRDTEGIALPTFLMMGLGSIFFAIQGLILKNWPLFITNVITTSSSAIVFGIKMYNDYFKKDRDK
jgi:MtN3 and saliva related transmembrane protein